MSPRCAECGEPLVSTLERLRKVCAVCYLFHRTRAEHRPPDRPEDRPWYRPPRGTASRPIREALPVAPAAATTDRAWFGSAEAPGRGRRVRRATPGRAVRESPESPRGSVRGDGARLTGLAAACPPRLWPSGVAGGTCRRHRRGD